MRKSTIPVTAVFDIGKTNKKFVLFDKDYSIVYEKQASFDKSRDDDGYPCEDLKLLTSWIHGELSAALKNPAYDITDINCSGYGASLVHLDEHGDVVGYLYDYMKPYPEDVSSTFYEAYGDVEKFSLETASPPMGMLNSGLQIYWLKQTKPELFRQIRHTLHFPQFMSYLITGEVTAELTSIGSHTAMWNFDKGKYHEWLSREDAEKLLPGIQPVNRVDNITYDGVGLKAGPGIHDSSAALAPYLEAMDDPFLLLSTGTWSITFNPFSKEPLTFDELQRDCLCYINIYGNQVKAARVFLGNEYRFQKEKLTRHFNIPDDQEDMAVNSELLRELIATSDPVKKLKLETAYNSGPFPSEDPDEWDISQFSSYEEAYHQLMLDLVLIQEECIRLAEGSSPVDNVIITGGFGNNDFFLKLLASRFPDRNIYTAVMPHATALGAALVMHNGQKDHTVDLKKLLGLKLHAGLENTGISEYRWSG